MKKNIFIVFLSLILLSSILTQDTTNIQTSTLTTTGVDTANLNLATTNTDDTTKVNNIYFTNSNPIDAIKNITDEQFKLNIFPIISKFPFDEQLIFANCYKSNTDSTRYVDPDCVKNSMESIKAIIGKGFGGNLTDYSKQIRGGLACLSKIVQIYGTSNDGTSKAIQTSISSIISQQSILNQCTAKFTKNFLELANLRKRFLITTKEIFAQSAVKDPTTSEVVGFVFTEDEKTSFVNYFKEYCLCIYNFFNNLNTEVSNIQTLIGTLDKCKVSTVANTTTNTSANTNINVNTNVSAPPTTNTGVTESNTSTTTNTVINNTGTTATTATGTNKTRLLQATTVSGTTTPLVATTASGGFATSAVCCKDNSSSTSCFACLNFQFCCSKLFTENTRCINCPQFDINNGRFFLTTSDKEGTSLIPPSSLINTATNNIVPPTPPVVPISGTNTSNASNIYQCCMQNIVIPNCRACDAAGKFCCSSNYNLKDCVSL